MQCYRYLAATAAVANTLEKVPGIQHRLPHSVIADWMAENDIEADEILSASSSAIEARIENLIRQNQPHMPHAA
jgi:uncharacterized Zn finger protein